MRWTLLLALPALLGSCNSTAIGFAAVSVVPIYGWEPGCTPLMVRGHGFDDGVAVSIGGVPLEGASLPEEGTSERGFQVYGTAPALTDGYADVVVTNADGATSTIAHAYRALACTRPANVEHVTVATDDGIAASGVTVNVDGCALDAATQVQVGTAAPVPLTSVCRSAMASFVAPDLAAGDHEVLFLDAAGVAVYPLPCELDSADTAGSCDAQVFLTYGGAP